MINIIYKTGITTLDKLLYKEIRHSYLIEIAGKRGSGKTQVSFSICAINSINNKKTIYIDGSGSFRPERIKSIIDNNLPDNEEKGKSEIYLKNISYQRIYDLDDLSKLIKKIKIMDFDFTIFDDIIPMFIYKSKDNTRSEVKRFVRDLSLITLLKKTCIIFTNIIYEKKDIDGKNIHSREIFFHDIIRYVHFKFYLQSNLNNLNDKRLIECKLIHPLIKHKSIDYINADKL